MLSRRSLSAARFLEYLHRVSPELRPGLDAPSCESGRPRWLPRVVTLALSGRLAVSHLHSPPRHTRGHWHLKAICSTGNVKKQRGGRRLPARRPAFVPGTAACPHKHLPLRARGGSAAAEQVLCFLDPSWGNNNDLNPNRNRGLSPRALCCTTFVCVWGFVTSGNEHLLPVTSGETGVRYGCHSGMPGLPLLLQGNGREPREAPMGMT